MSIKKIILNHFCHQKMGVIKRNDHNNFCKWMVNEVITFFD